MTSIVVDCMDSLAAGYESFEELSGRVIQVFSDDELLERTKGMMYPCVGVIYTGLMAKDEAGSTAKMGASSELIVSAMVFFRQNTVAVEDPKKKTLGMLDRIRSRILTTRSPSGHFWKFQLETPVVGNTGVLVYLQRWATPVQLTSIKK